MGISILLPMVCHSSSKNVHLNKQAMKKVLFNFNVEGAVETRKISTLSTEYSKEYLYTGAIHLVDDDAVAFINIISFVGVYNDIEKKVDEEMQKYFTDSPASPAPYMLYDCCISSDVEVKKVIEITED